MAFLETACHNRGVRVRIFTDRPSAMDWSLDGQEGLPDGKAKAAVRS